MYGQQVTPDVAAQTQSQPALEQAIRRDVIPQLLERHAAHGPLPETEALIESLLIGGNGHALAERAMARGTSFDTLMLNMLAPAARRLNDLWLNDQVSFATVTLAMWRLRSLMRALGEATTKPPLTNPMHSILVSTLPSEQHDFGAAMVAEFFSQDGWAAQHARPTTMAELVDHIRATGPSLLGLSIGRTEALPHLRQTIAAIRRALRRRAPAIMVGGAALAIDPTIGTRCGADGYSLCARTALTEAARLVDERAYAFPNPPRPSTLRGDQFVGLPNPRDGVSGPGTADHRATHRGRG